MIGQKSQGKIFLGQKQNLTRTLGVKDNNMNKSLNQIPKIDMSSYIVNSHNNEDVKNEPIIGQNYKTKEKTNNIEKSKKSKNYKNYV
jgi:hypothetical protein